MVKCNICGKRYWFSKSVKCDCAEKALKAAEYKRRYRDALEMMKDEKLVIPKVSVQQRSELSRSDPADAFLMASMQQNLIHASDNNPAVEDIPKSKHFNQEYGIDLGSVLGSSNAVSCDTTHNHSSHNSSPSHSHSCPSDSGYSSSDTSSSSADSGW